MTLEAEYLPFGGKCDLDRKYSATYRIRDCGQWWDFAKAERIAAELYGQWDKQAPARFRSDIYEIEFRPNGE